MMQPGRQFSAGSQHRYGFNGQEGTPEIAPNSTTAEFWQYDARIGRRWNLDPVVKVWESPYATFSNNPVLLSDINGADAGGGDEPVTTKATNLANVTIVAKITKKQSAINSVNAFKPSKHVDFGDRFTLGAFKQQLIYRINNPYQMDQGHKTEGYKKGGTNFCWAAAASSNQFERDPKQMAEFMMALFADGHANLGGITIYLTQALADAVGSNTFDNDGELKNSQVDQLLFLGLANSMKRYVNAKNYFYNKGDEDKDWASGTFGKFNELMKLYGNNIQKSQGMDVVSGYVSPTQVMDAQQAGEKIFLFIYNDFFKNPRPKIPDLGYYPTGPTGTHFIQVRNVTFSNGLYYMDIWDYGGWRKHTTGINDGQFRASVYGILTTK